MEGGERQALCTPEQVEQLIRYDHHRVNVGGRPGVMLTYHWMSEDAAEPFMLHVVFQYAEKHPPAPPEIQAIIDQLRFDAV